MTFLKISENLIELRRKKGITQDELATFLGVTKASVSKWETKQSYPDILLIPQIATFFGISTDELLGYQPQLSIEQINKLYQDLSADFTRLPYDEVIEKSEALVKEYYSCYQLQFHMINLWLNHAMLAPDPEKQTKLMNRILNVADHILTECKDVRICRDTIVIQSIANLQLGNPNKVIDALLPLNDLRQNGTPSESILIQAFLMAGETKKADQYNQVILYTHLMSMILSSIGLISMHLGDKVYCQMTIDRIEKLIELYEIDHLNPNSVLQFQYQAAIFYAVHQDKEQTLRMLKQFVTGTIQFIKDGVELHGDACFPLLDEWIDENENRSTLPRSLKLVLESVLQNITVPTFAFLSQEPEYIQLQLLLKKEVNNYDIK